MDADQFIEEFGLPRRTLNYPPLLQAAYREDDVRVLDEFNKLPVLDRAKVVNHAFDHVAEARRFRPVSNEEQQARADALRETLKSDLFTKPVEGDDNEEAWTEFERYLSCLHEYPYDDVSELRDILDAVLRHNVRGDDKEGYWVVGVYNVKQPYATRPEAEAAYVDFAKRRREWPDGNW